MAAVCNTLAHCERPSLTAGDWVDDYHVDEDYRNDLGFLYCAHVRVDQAASSGGGDAQGTSTTSTACVESLELVPTRIVHTWLPWGQQHPPNLSEVRVATEHSDREWLAQRMRLLCAAWGTGVEERDGRLIIPCAAPEQHEL